MKSNKFMVGFVLPSCFGGDPEASIYLTLNRDAGLWCDSASLPGTTQHTAKIRRYGYGNDEQVPISASFEDIQLRFLSDGQGLYWNMFHRWLNKTVNKDSSRGMWIADGATPSEVSSGSNLDPYETAYQSTYSTDFEITVYDDTGSEIRNVVLNQAYPTAVSDIKLDWGDNGDVARFMVNVTYQDWHEVRTNV